MRSGRPTAVPTLWLLNPRVLDLKGTLPAFGSHVRVPERDTKGEGSLRRRFHRSSLWVYAGTSNGRLIAFRTDDPADDGWPMWGGGPGHNGS